MPRHAAVPPNPRHMGRVQQVFHIDRFSARKVQCRGQFHLCAAHSTKHLKQTQGPDIGTTRTTPIRKNIKLQRVIPAGRSRHQKHIRPRDIANAQRTNRCARLCCKVLAHLFHLQLCRPVGPLRMGDIAFMKRSPLPRPVNSGRRGHKYASYVRAMRRHNRAARDIDMRLHRDMVIFVGAAPASCKDKGGAERALCRHIFRERIWVRKVRPDEYVFWHWLCATKLPMHLKIFGRRTFSGRAQQSPDAARCAKKEEFVFHSGSLSTASYPHRSSHHAQ